MQKLGLKLSQHQKLSPQQIQFIKLLEVPTADLENRIELELEINPALEINRDATMESEGITLSSEDEVGDDSLDPDLAEGDLVMDEMLNADDMDLGYKMQGDGPDPNEEEREVQVKENLSLYESLIAQLDFLQLTETDHQIGLQIIGSLDDDGYLRRHPEALANDLAFSQNIICEEDDVLRVLNIIQQFDPNGIAARSLQECISIQLAKMHPNPVTRLAKKIIDFSFDEFSKKHFDKIMAKYNLEESELKAVMETILRCNPKPGGNMYDSTTEKHIIPDFILAPVQGDSIEILLNSKNAPELYVSAGYKEMLQTYEKASQGDKKLKEAVQFVKQKIDSAKWFIDAIKQRQNTLLVTMNAIVQLQKAYFQTGDDADLKPMILKDVSEMVGMDVSTISRIVSSKTVQTEFGTLPLKHLFSESISTESGEDVSNREIKQEVSKIIAEEDKSKPLGDEEIEKLLLQKGYIIARRTVAKYREQLGLPVARLRKQI